MTPGVLIILAGIILLTILISPVFCRRFHTHGRILALHSLQPKFLDFGAVSAKTLNQVIDGCRNRGLRIGTIEEAILREDTVAITFDDGYDDILQMLPLLGEHRITITVFVPTAFIGKTNSWDSFLLKNKRRHLSEEQIKQLVAAGVEFGSHSHSHWAPSIVVLTIFTRSSSLAIEDASITASFQSPLNSFRSSSIDRVLFTIRQPPGLSPSTTLISVTRPGSSTTTISGFTTPLRTRMGCSADIRLKASTGAPRLSGPKLGNACANFPSCMADMAVKSAEVTAPCPPRPCQRISMVSPCFISNYLKY